MFKRLLAALLAVCLLAPSAASAAYQFANRAWMTSATTGTGTITLGSAVTSYLTFAQAGISNGNTVTYVIIDGNNFEIGRGVYTSVGTTLSRSVLISLSGGVSGTSLLSLSGTETVYITPAAEDMLSTNTPITVGQGGTGITSGTSGGVPYFSGASAISSSGALSANQLVLGGGAGAAPTSLGAGTTTTLLHGNAAGAPSFGSVVSGDLNITGTTCTNQFVTAISAAAAGTCTTDTLASAQHANQGTTTTLLHGNAAGNPSWAGVSLTADAAANQGSTTTVLHGNAAGQPSFAGVSLTADATANQGSTTTVLHGNAAGQPSFGSIASGDLNITGTTCTNQFLTALSSSAAGTCTTATLASAQFANQGTATTVLHGNGAGNPSFGSVALGSDISGTLGIGNGGTAQTTALAARGSSGLDVEAGTGHGDSIYTILATDRFVYTNAAFTASRTWTLPAANAVNAGGSICVGDEQGTVTAANTLVISRAGTDTINGGTTYTLNAANQGVCLVSDGTSKWNVANIPATRLPAFTGDATSTAGTSALTLATVYAGSSPVGGATAIPVLTINGKGLITATSTATPTVTAVNGISWPASGTSGGVPYFSSTSAISSSGALAANQLVLGGGAGVAPSSLGAGTTTTVLHGNAAGAPSFGSVASGDLNITTTSCTNQFVTALSAGAVGTCSTATLAGGQFANQGTTTTLLHGNAAGNPSWAGVSLTNDAAANQGTTTTVLHGNAAGQPSFAGVSLINDAAANQGTTTTVLHGNAAGQPSFGSIASGDLNITTTTCTNQFVTAISASAAGTCTTATLAGAQYANQGTTTTVLHGNAAGNPTWGSVAISTDVSGLGSGVATWLGTPTLANLNSALGVTVKTAGTETLWIPATALTANTTNGCAAGTVETTTNLVMQKTCNFDPTTQQSAQFTVAMPKSWNNGTITAIFYWSHPSTTTNFGTVWDVACVYVPTNSATDVAFGTAQLTATSTGGTTDNLYISAATAATTCAGTPASGGLTYFRVRRVPANAGDTLAVVARLIGVKINYTSNATNDT